MHLYRNLEWWLWEWWACATSAKRGDRQYCLTQPVGDWVDSFRRIYWPMKVNPTRQLLRWSGAPLTILVKIITQLINTMRCSLSVAMLQISRNLMMMVNFFARTPTKRCRIYWSITGSTTSTIGEVLLLLQPTLKVPSYGARYCYCNGEVQTYGPKQYKADNLYVGVLHRRRW